MDRRHNVLPPARAFVSLLLVKDADAERDDPGQHDDEQRRRRANSTSD